MKILGIDPGYDRCGFAVLDGEDLVTFGTMVTDRKQDFSSRLAELADDFQALLKKHEPDVVSIEDLFFGQNVTTGLKVAEARGVMLYLAQKFGCRVYEPKPVEIKQSFTGNGKATKAEMKKMCCLQFGMEDVPKIDDAADAIGAAMWASRVRF
ncbi:crossover junction endodeoxyribonuclease RuvC [Candidatus Gracilibacteria bacterium]|nr:crossover junction endodeoxyribonuclease RuvC [Candidatus Gracilibacteria bacterium]